MSTIRMPQLGESVVEGTVGKWLVQEGQRIEKDQPVVEILTDKADSEINASEAGVVTKIIALEGATVAVGDALCEVDAAAQPSASAAAAKSSGKKSVPPPAPEPAAAPAQEQRAAAGPPGDSQSSPAVRKLAREQGVDLAVVAGSGNGGRVTKDDVLRAGAVKVPSTFERDSSIPPAIKPAPVPQQIPRAPAVPVSAPSSSISSGAFKNPPYIPRAGDQEIPMSRRRRIIADHMVYSKLTSPHVVTFAEVDVLKTESLRKANKDALKKEGVNLTFLAFVAAATARALRENKVLNARVLSDSYVLLGEINLGIAVDTAEGLVVPVIRNAADLTVRGLAKAIDELAAKARDGKLTPDDLASKTFTITNPGRKGNLVGGAIISQPNVGILRTGEIRKRVVVVEQEDQDVMAIHPVMQMALSYDHRIVDGVAANNFLYRVRELLEAGEFTL
ncbi:MAG TPA: dihydrolipoamide acetyltransferase family protein [Polyangiales bacterium]|nr:dihydrolipoamide acetyltransferase family protein [Polyangiales bacterium]